MLVENDSPRRANSRPIGASDFCFQHISDRNFPLGVASNARTRKHVVSDAIDVCDVCLEDSSRLFAAFRTLSGTRVFPEIQLRQVQQRNGVLMSAATGQRVRPQLSVCN